MIFLIYKIILEIYKIDGGENFETSNFYKNRLKTRVLCKNNHKKWIVDFVDSSSRGDLHNKLTQFSITGQLLWKMSRPPVSEQNLGPLANSCQFFFDSFIKRWLTCTTNFTQSSITGVYYEKGVVPLLLEA